MLSISPPPSPLSPTPGLSFVGMCSLLNAMAFVMWRAAPVDTETKETFVPYAADDRCAHQRTSLRPVLGQCERLPGNRQRDGARGSAVRLNEQPHVAFARPAGAFGDAHPRHRACR